MKGMLECSLLQSPPPLSWLNTPKDGCKGLCCNLRQTFVTYTCRPSRFDALYLCYFPHCGKWVFLPSAEVLCCQGTHVPLLLTSHPHKGSHQALIPWGVITKPWDAQTFLTAKKEQKNPSFSFPLRSLLLVLSSKIIKAAKSS
jgi:hypothetical protein